MGNQSPFFGSLAERTLERSNHVLSKYRR